MKKRTFTVLIERDENGTFIAEIPDLKGCYTQGNSIEEVMRNMKEVVEMCLEGQQGAKPNEFIGVQKIEVEA